MNVGEQTEEAIFKAAIKLESPAERMAYVRQACGSNEALRARLDVLLQAHDEAGNFLEAPPFDLDAALESPPVCEGPGTIIGRYKLLERIGEGGMAVVYMAEQEQPIRRKVALKIIKLGMDTKSVIARFEAERQALALMDHPNIARVFDAGATETGRPYFVMEMVTGVSITEYCDANNLSTKDRLALFVQVCNAVQHAHQKGIIHRDIKPSNVMVTQRDGKPVPKVIDFGIAKATNQKLTEKTLFTRYAHIIGTPAYMSPEQAELSDVDIDTRSDIYSLGVLLYELLTGATPFSEEELREAGYAEMQRIIREEEPTKPSTKLSTLGDSLTDVARRRSCSPELLRKHLRGDLDWIVMKSLEKDRTRRYDSTSALLEDIKRHLNHDPVSAGPPGAWYRTKKFVLRHRAWLTTVAAVTVVISASLAVTASLYKRVERVDFDRRLSVTQQLYAEGRYQAALAEMENQHLNKATDARARLLYAQILVDLGQGDEAMAQLHNLAEADAEIAGAAHYLLARLHSSNAPKKSREHRQQAEAILPSTADGYALRALTAPTPDEAVTWLNQALSVDPSHFASRKARALVRYGQRDYARMLRDVEAIIALRPNDSLGYALRALARRELGELEEALCDQDRALELCQAHSELLNLYEQRRETLWRLGNYEAALEDARQCVALAPETVAYRAQLGKLLFTLGQYEKAKEEFARVRADSGALWQGVKTMAQYALEMTRAGRPLDIPDGLATVWPFRFLPRYADLNAQLEEKGTCLVRGALDVSSWSPDGRQLAYTRSEFCEWGENRLKMGGSSGPVVARGIEILDLESGHTRVLVTSGGTPNWSRDGRYIAFVRASWMATGADAEMWVIAADGGEPRRLAPGASPCWTNHPTRLYFHSRIQEALCCIDVAHPGAQPRRVAACPGWYPEVSPDERYLAYAKNGELTVVELSSGEVVVTWVVPGPEKYCCVRWSPDGKEISMGVLGMRNLCSGLWIFDFERRRGWHLLDAEAVSCNWSSDRSRVAFDMFFPVSEIWTAEIDPDLPTWKSLAPLQTRGQYMRTHWDKYVASYARAWSNEKEDVLRNLTTVGVNQYDYGQYEDALWTLRHVAELRRARNVRADAETDAYIVMALQQTGRRDEAVEALRQLRRPHEQTEADYDPVYIEKVDRFLAGDNRKPQQVK